MIPFGGTLPSGKFTRTGESTMWWFIPLLVGGLEHDFYDFPYIGNVIIPSDFHSIIFQRGR